MQEISEQELRELLSNLHPAAQSLADATTDYRNARSRLASLKRCRDQARREMKEAMARELAADPTTTNVALASWFGVTEGTVRNLRAEIAGRS